jgi:hypothetical protein
MSDTAPCLNMMMVPQVYRAQVRQGNFADEIPFGISYGGIARYGTACQGNDTRSMTGRGNPGRHGTCRPRAWHGMLSQCAASPVPRGRLCCLPENAAR